MERSVSRLPGSACDMWHAFRTSPLRFVYDGDYGVAPGPDPWSLPLDEIKVWGNITEPPLTYDFSRVGWRSLHDEQFFLTEVLRERVETVISQRTDAKYADHITRLYEWGLLDSIQDPLIAARYFSVVKRGRTPQQDTARTIHDGRGLNIRCHRPPPVNIPDPLEVAAYAASLKVSKLSIWLADFRHFFHQFRIDEYLRKYVSILMGTKWYAWRTLPMGFAWAPFIAQAIAMGMLLEATTRWHTRDYAEDTGIPRFITLARGPQVARVYLTYDNVAIVCSDASFCEELSHAILARLRRSHVELKEQQLFRAADLRLGSDEEGKAPCVHLGVQYALTAKGVRLRIAPKTADRWLAALGGLRPGRHSKRQAAKIAGVILHSHRICDPSTAPPEAVLKLLRSLYPLTSWEEEIDVEEEVLELLSSALRNTWSNISAMQPYDCIAASDASGCGLGYVLVDTKKPHEVAAVYSDPQAFPKVEGPHQAIFLKELIAALHAVLRAKSLGFRRVLLLVDNTAAAAAIANGFSCNPQGHSIVLRIRAACDTLGVVPIPGLANPADEPSRGLELCERKLSLLSKMAVSNDFAPILTKKVKRQEPLLEDPDESLDEKIFGLLGSALTRG
jgi:hypothetical protein